MHGTQWSVEVLAASPSRRAPLYLTKRMCRAKVVDSVSEASCAGATFTASG